MALIRPRISTRQRDRLCMTQPGRRNSVVKWRQANFSRSVPSRNYGPGPNKETEANGSKGPTITKTPTLSRLAKFTANSGTRPKGPSIVT